MATGKPARRGVARGGGRKKKQTLLLNQAPLDRARPAFGARTEAAAVRQAREAVSRRGQQVQGIRALATLGPIDPAPIA